jgi:ubiquinone/menaquinone biosynthesis C-methylase UbiE
LVILEVGCGNGWLSNQISKIPQTNVICLDINSIELVQACTVFTARNLNFILGDLRSLVLLNTKFDIILFAASISYFSSLNETIQTALQYLTSRGEIHIIDTFFYDEKEVNDARQRSNKYFIDMGLMEMANHFYHHTLHNLQNFNYTSLQKKRSLLQIFFKQKIVLPWICIKSD